MKEYEQLPLFFENVEYFAGRPETFYFHYYQKVKHIEAIIYTGVFKDNNKTGNTISYKTIEGLLK